MSIFDNHIDYNRVFERIPEITNLPVIRKGRHWLGKCYLDGTPHERRDKLCITLVDGRVLLTEQGGDTITIKRWLVDYGGCDKHADVKANYREANMTLRDCKPSSFVYYDYQKVREFREVTDEQLTKTTSPNVKSTPLYKWLCTLFDETKVAEAFKRYNVRTDKYNNTVWLYTNKQGKTLHDKRMKYLPNGHRDRESKFSQSRWFKTDKGYTGQCYFGEHLLGGAVRSVESEKISLVESEKTAIICYLTYGGIWLATGGASNLREVEPNWKVYADNDAAGRMWESRLGEQCVKWYDEGCVDGWDLGDKIIREI